MPNAITRAQREAIQRIYNRGPIYKNGLSSNQIATQHGWKFVEVTTLPPELAAKVDAKYTHVWVHEKYLPMYEDADGLCKDYCLAEEVRYREFRKTVLRGHDCLMVEWRGMWLGIEANGYTHS